MPRFRALVRGATIQFVRKHSCKAPTCRTLLPLSQGLQVAAQDESGVRHKEALTSAYEAWS